MHQTLEEGIGFYCSACTSRAQVKDLPKQVISPDRLMSALPVAAAAAPHDLPAAVSFLSFGRHPGVCDLMQEDHQRSDSELLYDLQGYRATLANHREELARWKDSQLSHGPLKSQLLQAAISQVQDDIDLREKALRMRWVMEDWANHILFEHCHMENNPIRHGAQSQKRTGESRREIGPIQ
jgi:hypothetical protein